MEANAMKVKGTEENGANGSKATEEMESGLDRLRGKVALVTGASAGIGRACAEALVELGMRVAVCARRTEKLESLREAVADRGYRREAVLPLRCDVQSETDIQAVLRAVEDTWREAPAVVINSAGLSREDTTMLDGSTASWTEMMQTNVIAVAIVTREAVAAMRRRGSALHVVNVSSMSAYRIPRFAGGGFYAATKHALRCISDGTRIEALQAGLPLRVTCLSPGVVETEFYHVRHGGAADSVSTAYEYEPLHTEHVVQALLYAIGAPTGVNVDDVIFRSTAQPL